MAMIHVARDGTNIGSFRREEVQEGLRSGRFLPTDMAWEEGMPAWRPIAQVMADKPAAAIPAPGPAGINPLPIASSAPSSPASGGGLPWERRQELGLVKAFFDTMTIILTQPTAAFAAMKTEGGLIEPLLYAVIGGAAGIIGATVLTLPLNAIGLIANRESGALGVFGTGLGLIVQIVLGPLFVAIGMFILGGLVHLSLMLLGGVKKPFETTFRVVCFSFGSTLLIGVVPLCGVWIAGIYGLVLDCLGIARTHEIGGGKAVLAVLLPLIACCGALVLCGLVVGGSVLSLFSKH